MEKMTREEQLEQIKPYAGKYKLENGEIDYKRQETDKKIRWEIALEDGEDPLGNKTIEDLFKDWQWIRNFIEQYNK